MTGVSWFFFFSSRRRHTRYIGDWSSDVCSSDLRPRRGHGPAPADLLLLPEQVHGPVEVAPGLQDQRLVAQGALQPGGVGVGRAAGRERVGRREGPEAGCARTRAAENTTEFHVWN